MDKVRQQELKEYWDEPIDPMVKKLDELIKKGSYK